MRLMKLLLGCMVSTCMSLMAGSPVDARPPVPPPVHKPATPPPNPTNPSMQHGSGKPTTPPPVNGPTAPLNPIAAKIASKPQLSAKVTGLLQPSGMSLNDASNGFKNQGQFLAALNVSRNLGIPFSSLKQDMTVKKLSLGQSIQDLKKSADTGHETERAEREANDDLKETSAARPSNTDSRHGSSGQGSLATRITKNPTLAAKVQALLPTGMKLQQASAGFRSTEQFLAALHASKNLGIPFAQLQAEMTGKDHDSLTAAIRELKPGTNASQQAGLAETQARQDLKSSKPSATGDAL